MMHIKAKDLRVHDYKLTNLIEVNAKDARYSNLYKKRQE